MVSMHCASPFFTIACKGLCFWSTADRLLILLLFQVNLILVRGTRRQPQRLITFIYYLPNNITAAAAQVFSGLHHIHSQHRGSPKRRKSLCTWLDHPEGPWNGPSNTQRHPRQLQSWGGFGPVLTTGKTQKWTYRLPNSWGNPNGLRDNYVLIRSLESFGSSICKKIHQTYSHTKKHWSFSFWHSRRCLRR